jgi:GT2 family glycosyltransferase
LSRADSLSASVIVTTHNRIDRLRLLCESLGRAYVSGSRFELVVTVDGVSDGSAEFLAGLIRVFPVRVLTQTRSGPAAGRNRAIAVASGDVLVFLDDDVIPLPGLIEQHLAIHRTDPRAVAIGPMLPPRDCHLPAWLRWEAVTLRKQYDAMLRGEYTPTPRQFYTANASVRRSHALAAGGFDESFTRAEDVEFAYRLADRGLRFHFLPEAAVIHDPVRSWDGWLDVAREYGRHAVIFQRDRGRDQLRLAYEELSERHPMNRLLARICVGHRHRTNALRRIAGAVATRKGGRRWDRLQMGLCSAAYSAGFWQGVAEETGLGKRVWAAR